tara:strand:- start:913 stop:1494 length:582 start_codon:yes stop_codon:yes gene_type:complete
MSSFSPIKSKYISNNCEPDMDESPQYGIVEHRDIDDRMKAEFTIVAKEFGKEVRAKVHSGNETIRKVKCWRIPTHSYIGDVLNREIVNANDVFNYKISNIQDIQYLEYSVGDFYNWHSDICYGLSSTRKISISCPLNYDYTGGQLEIMSDGEVVTCNEDYMVSFTSFLPHRVKKITKGTRKCLVAWVNGESWR